MEEIKLMQLSDDVGGIGYSVAWGDTCGEWRVMDWGKMIYDLLQGRHLCFAEHDEL